jgi:ArsR family transcriptional regulator
MTASTRPLLEEPSAAALAETFRVLGDVTRVRILDAISRTELCVNDIAALVGLSESAVSHQLRLLRGMRLVRPRREGRMVFYTLDDHHIVGLFEQGLEHVQERRLASTALPILRQARSREHGRGAGPGHEWRPAPCASSTPNRLSKSKGWIAARKWRSSSGASSICLAWRHFRRI